jgi:hypothetical protein
VKAVLGTPGSCNTTRDVKESAHAHGWGKENRKVERGRREKYRDGGVCVCVCGVCVRVRVRTLGVVWGTPIIGRGVKEGCGEARVRDSTTAPAMNGCWDRTIAILQDVQRFTTQRGQVRRHLSTLVVHRPHRRSRQKDHAMLKKHKIITSVQPYEAD